MTRQTQGQGLAVGRRAAKVNGLPAGRSQERPSRPGDGVRGVGRRMARGKSRPTNPSQQQPGRPGTDPCGRSPGGQGRRASGGPKSGTIRQAGSSALRSVAGRPGTRTVRQARVSNNPADQAQAARSVTERPRTTGLRRAEGCLAAGREALRPGSTGVRSAGVANDPAGRGPRALGAGLGLGGVRGRRVGRGRSGRPPDRSPQCRGATSPPGRAPTRRRTTVRRGPAAAGHGRADG